MLLVGISKKRERFFSAFAITVLFCAMWCGMYAVELQAKSDAYTDNMEILRIVPREERLQYDVTLLGDLWLVDLGWLNEAEKWRQICFPLIPASWRFADQLCRLVQQEWRDWDYQRRIWEFEENVLD